MLPRLLIAACLCAITLHAAEPRELATKVSHVTIYPEWAFVSRTAEIDVPAGQSSYVIRGLPAWIDEESIRASCSKPGEVTILAAAAKTVYLTKSSDAEVRAAETARQVLVDKVEDLNATLKVLETERDFLGKLLPWRLEKVPQEAAARPVTAAELQGVNTYLSTALQENATKLAAVRRQLRDLQPEVTAKEKAWNETKKRNRLEAKEITVDLEAKAGAKTALEVGYLISGASWYPSYDARTDDAREQVRLQGQAIVQQSTGEEWSDATFTLSTINPYRTRVKPELKPWYIDAGATVALAPNASLSTLNFRSSEVNGKLGLIQQKQQDLNADNKEFQAAFSNYAANPKLAAEVVRQVEERGTTVEFEIAGKYAVKSDGLPVKLPLGEAVVAAERRFSVTPAVSKSTYVTGLARNPATYPFLPGPVRVFIGGSFVGQSQLSFVAEREKFELYLGLEDRIKVTRDLDAKKSSTALLSSRKRLNVAYRLQVKNFLKVPAVVTIVDQVPVSQDANVKVKLVDVTPRAESVEKGLLTWNLPLAAGEEKTLTYEFHLDCPAEAELPAAARMMEEQILKQ